MSVTGSTGVVVGGAEENTNVDTAETPKSDVVTVGKPFLVLASVAQFVALVGFAILGRHHGGYWGPEEDPVYDTQLYNNFIGVTIMLFVGFGYLMTYLRWYGYSAIGLTIFVTCLGMQFAILSEAIVESGFVTFSVDTMMLLRGDFAVAAFLISFGGLLGKVNPAQLVVLVVLETICYSVNNYFLLVSWLEIRDAGGSIIIHMFGAYFGLAACWVLGVPSKMKVGGESTSSISDLLAFIGTVFLWVYWPTFVVAWMPTGTWYWQISITNTVLAMLSSTVCTFICSVMVSGNLIKPGHIQNATLAGGVAIGAVADFDIQPIGALLIGCAAGVLSTLGSRYVQSSLLVKLKVHDTCGVHNLHGMPSILGALCSVFFPLFLDHEEGDMGLPGNQFLGMLGTLFFSIITGAATGGVMTMLKDNGEAFNDKMYWKAADEPGVQVSDV